MGQWSPRIHDKNHESVDDEHTIKCAYRRNCYFLDNDNYRDWVQQMKNENVRNWMRAHQSLLHMRYYFDSELGTFDLLEGNQPASVLASGTYLDKWSLSTASR